jgi:hypothetical protein
MNMIKGFFAPIGAFLNGIWEFRQSFTTYYAGWNEWRAYDSGRELAHRVTLRRFDS